MLLHAERSGQSGRSRRRGRQRIVDLLAGLVVLSSLATVGAATLAGRLHDRETLEPPAEVAGAVGTLRRTFGYDGVVHELQRLRRDNDPQAKDALAKSLRSARSAIGLLRRQLADGDREVAKALDQLELAGRGLETILRAAPDAAPPGLVELPVLEPLFVLDRATAALQEALRQEDRSASHRILWAIAAAASLLAATGLILAGWTRLALLVPLRRLAHDLSQGSRTGIETMTGRQDEFGTLARSLLTGPLAEQSPIEADLPTESSQLRDLIEDQGRVLAELRVLLAGRPELDHTNEPEPAAAGAAPATPLVILRSEPKPTEELQAVHRTGTRPDMLHSIVEIVAKEQVRRHHGLHPEPSAPVHPDEQLMATLVDRVLARLDQVTERVNLKGVAAGERRAS